MVVFTLGCYVRLKSCFADRDCNVLTCNKQRKNLQEFKKHS